MAEAAKKRKPAQEHEPIFSDAEVVIVGVILVVLDCADLFQFGVPASDIISWGIQTYEYKKGTSGLIQIITAIFELPPGWDVGPWRSIAFGLIVWGDWHPDSIMAKLIKVGEMVAAVKGKLQAKKGTKGGAQGPNGVPVATPGANAGLTGSTTQEELDKFGEGMRPGELRMGSTTQEELDKFGEGMRPGELRMGSTTQEEMKRRAEAEEPKSPEDQELEDIMSGDLLGQHLLRSMSTEEILATIGEQKISSRFNPNVMGPEMAPKPAKQWAATNNQTPKNTPKGIINNEQVDLKNPEKKELLQDAV